MPSADKFLSVAQAFVSERLPMLLPLAGNSMQPMLPNGTIVIVTPLQRRLHSGACYAFLQDGGIVCHRLVRKRKNTVVFAGDNNAHAEIAPLDSLVGVAKTNEGKMIQCLFAAINAVCVQDNGYIRFHKFRSICFRIIAGARGFNG